MHCLAHIFRILLICPYTEPYAHIPVPLTWFPVVYSKVINLIVLVEFCLWWNKNVKRFWHVISQCPSVFCQSAHDRWQFKGRLPGSAKRAGFRGRWSLTLGSQSRTAGHSAVKCFLICPQSVLMTILKPCTPSEQCFQKHVWLVLHNSHQTFPFYVHSETTLYLGR